MSNAEMYTLLAEIELGGPAEWASVLEFIQPRWYHAKKSSKERARLHRLVRRIRELRAALGMVLLL
jgi:hypothetical protein